MFSVPSALLDEDREQADDDRQDAESFGERREDDRDAADLAGCVRVPAASPVADWERLASTLKPPKTPDATLAAPSPISSWSGSIS